MTDTVHVLRVPLSPEAARGLDLPSLLSDAEVRRLRRLSGDRRTGYLLSHAAARLILAARLGTRPHRLRWRTGRRGKPGPVEEPRRCHWNLSHSREWALIAASETTPLGVDLVRVDDLGEPERLTRRFFTPAEAERLRRRDRPDAALTCATLLARKEACVKAVGATVFDGLRLDVAASGRVRGPGSGPLAGRTWTLVDLEAPPGHVAALATAGGAPVRTVQRDWRWPQAIPAPLSDRARADERTPDHVH